LLWKGSLKCKKQEQKKKGKENCAASRSERGEREQISQSVGECQCQREVNWPTIKFIDRKGKKKKRKEERPCSPGGRLDLKQTESAEKSRERIPTGKKTRIARGVHSVPDVKKKTEIKAKKKGESPKSRHLDLTAREKRR